MKNIDIPLAERMRPRTIAAMYGQKHLLGEHGAIKKIVNGGILPSIILWGPPGVGKTTIAKILASELGLPFIELSAISAGVKEVREAIDKAKEQNKTVLFIDEIHRFSKSQQDALLGAVEKGIITLIGATTENPSFEVISALLSRCQVYTLKPLQRAELEALVQYTVKHDEFLATKNIQIKETEVLINLSGGDARKLLNLFELAINSSEKTDIIITDQLLIDIAQQKVAMYDKKGEMHYDIISAFIKSIRGSDPNAAVYWLARMIEGGEDVAFIARRLVILASEDIGNANPTAIVMATTCFQAVKVIGYPESDIILSQCVTYLAASPKSNAAYVAIKQAKDLVHKESDLPVPMHLRNAPTKLMKAQGYGKEYQYAHNFQENFIHQEYLPDKIAGLKLYDPADNARENELRQRLKKLWKDKYQY